MYFIRNKCNLLTFLSILSKFHWKHWHLHFGKFLASPSSYINDVLRLFYNNNYLHVFNLPGGKYTCLLLPPLLLLLLLLAIIKPGYLSMTTTSVSAGALCWCMFIMSSVLWLILFTVCRTVISTTYALLSITTSKTKN